MSLHQDVATTGRRSYRTSRQQDVAPTGLFCKISNLSLQQDVAPAGHRSYRTSLLQDVPATGRRSYRMPRQQDVPSTGRRCNRTSLLPDFLKKKVAKVGLMVKILDHSSGDDINIGCECCVTRTSLQLDVAPTGCHPSNVSICYY